MFKRQVITIDEAVHDFLRRQSLEMPLLQRRLLCAWEKVNHPIVARYTTEKFIKNQTLFVRIVNPALRENLSMRKAELVNLLNGEVKTRIINDIRFI